MHIAPPLTQRRTPAAHPARGRRFRIWWLLPLALLIVAGLVIWWYQSRSAATTTTTTTTVSQGALTLTVSGSGTVAAARTVDLSFQQAGTVTSVDVTIGDQVKAGQILARIDPTDLQLQLQQAQASLKAAEATLVATKTGGAISQDLASAQASLDSAKAQLAKTKTSTVTDVQSAQVNLASAQAKLDALSNPTQADRAAAQRARSGPDRAPEHAQQRLAGQDQRPAGAAEQRQCAHAVPIEARYRAAELAACAGCGHRPDQPDHHRFEWQEEAQHAERRAAPAILRRLRAGPGRARQRPECRHPGERGL